jgi:glycosyltransferase involved in cell wall biosynthesis
VEGPLGVSYKNVEKTIELCRQAEVDEIWLLTSSEVTDYPGVNRCFSRVPITETAAIYRSCDLLVKLSYVEGMFGPPLEMFHCGGTALVYDVTGHDEYIRHQQNSIVVPRGR